MYESKDLARFSLWASLAHFIFSYLLHSHWLLLNPLGFLDPITTSFAFGFIGLWTNPIYYFLDLGSSDPFLLYFYFLWFPWAYYLILRSLLGSFCFLWGHLLSCGLVNHYSCHFGSIVVTLLLGPFCHSYHSFFILLGFFCHWALLSKWASTFNPLSIWIAHAVCMRIKKKFPFYFFSLFFS